MKRTMYAMAAVVSLLATQPIHSQSQLRPFAGARSVGMANTTTVFKDIYCAFGNQSGLAFLEQPAVAVQARNHYALASIYDGGVAAAMPLQAAGTVAVSLHQFGNADYQEQTIGLAYARKLSETLSLSGQVDVFSVRIGEYGSKALATFEVGLLAMPFKRVRLGAHLFSPVRTAVSADDDLPTRLAVGIGYELNRQLLVVGEVEKDVFYAPTYRFGVDYRVIDLLSVRLGTSLQPMVNSFGIGLHRPRWAIEMAAQHHPTLGVSPSVSVAYQFGRGEVGE